MTHRSSSAVSPLSPTTTWCALRPKRIRAPQIIYKPHPDILNRVRLAQSNPRDVQHLCQIIAQPLSMGQAFETIDHVYTITSLAGFEALLRGLTVTVYGCPFYAGWGLTDDRQPNERRDRNLSIEALFAGAYLLYPRYFDPMSGKSVSFEETVDGISRHFAKEKREPEPARRSLRLGPPWRAWGPYGILGWRHLLTPPLAFIISKIGNNHDAQWFRQDPILFLPGSVQPKVPADWPHPLSVWIAQHCPADHASAVNRTPRVDTEPSSWAQWPWAR